MHFSVIVLPASAPADTGRTLEALRRQTFDWFEAVVAGAAPVASHPDWTTIPVTEGENPAAGWNRAAAWAAGDAVAFIEAGAVPEPRWLESFAAALDGGATAAGGPAGLEGGTWSLCDRRGLDRGRADEPVWPYATPGADVFLRLPPRNCCIRRDRYLGLGGLDADLPWPLPVAGLCARLLDRGWVMRHAPGAVVHHDAPPERWPRLDDALAAPAEAVRAAALFALRNSPHETGAEALRRCHEDFEVLLRRARQDGGFAAGRLAELEDAVERGLWSGAGAGHSRPRRLHLVPAGRELLPFATVRAEGERLRVAVVATPGGDHAWSLARRLADLGHEIHYLSPSGGKTALRFEEGVWIDDPAAVRAPHAMPAAMDAAGREALRLAAAVHQQVRGLHDAHGLDVVCVPHDAAEGLYCLLDDDLTCALHGPPPEESSLPAALLTLMRDLPRPVLPPAHGEALERLRRACAGGGAPPDPDPPEAEAAVSATSRRPLTVSMVTGLIVHRDGISNHCREQLDAISRYGRASGRPVRLKVYALACQPRDSRVAVAADAAAVAADGHFNDSDVIHYHFGVYYPLFDSIHLAPRRARVGVTFHGITPPHLVPEAARPALHRAYRQAGNLHLADTVVTTSNHLAGELERFGVPRDRVTVIPVPAGFDRLPDPSLRPPPGPELRLAYVGRLVPAKGLHDLVDAAADFVRRGGGPLRVDLVGSKTFSDRVYLDRLVGRVAEAGLGDVVRFHFDAPEADLQAILLAAGAVVIPSMHEGFCVPVIEALATRCFVICSDAGALPETAGGLGRTYPAGDAAALGRRIAEFAAARLRGGFPTDGGFLTRAEWEAKVAAYLPAFTRARYHARFCATVFAGIHEMTDEARAAMNAARRQAVAGIFPAAAPCRTTAVADAVARALAG